MQYNKRVAVPPSYPKGHGEINHKIYQKYFSSENSIDPFGNEQQESSRTPFTPQLTPIKLMVLNAYGEGSFLKEKRLIQKKYPGINRFREKNNLSRKCLTRSLNAQT